MASLMEIALNNVLVAFVLAIPATLAAWWGRRPAVTHALWLLVLLKLITPPLFECPLPWLEGPPPPEAVALVNADIAEEVIAPLTVPIDEPLLPLAIEPAPIPAVELPAVPAERAPVVAPPMAPAAVAPAAPEAGPPWKRLDVVFGLWLVGAIVWLAIALWRLWRFQRLLRFAEPAPQRVQAMASHLSDCLGVRCPDVRVIPGQVSPMLWTLGRSRTLLLPAGLLGRLSEAQLATLLAHELAHWRRRDDRVRWLEFAVLCLYWWCPLAWWARRELHQAEEECCDAWVVSLLPDSAKDYALALVETVDFLCAAPAPLPVLASGVGRVRHLKRRLTMILQGKTPRTLTFTGLVAVAAIGLLMLPLFFARARSVQVAAQDRGGPDRKQDDGNPGIDFTRPGPDVRRLQEEIQKRQHEVQQRMQELHKMMEHLQQLQGNRDGQGGTGNPGGKGRPGGQNPPGQGDGGPRGKGPGVPGGFPPGAGGPGGRPGFPGGGPDFGGRGGPGGGPGNIEQRLQQFERKLDMILNELRHQRGNPRPQGQNPTNDPRPTPKSGGTPRPRPANPPPSRTPTGGGADPSVGTPPRPPVPPTPPRPVSPEEPNLPSMR